MNREPANCTQCGAPRWDATNGTKLVRRLDDPAKWSLDIDLFYEYPCTWDRPGVTLLRGGLCRWCRPKMRGSRR